MSDQKDNLSHYEKTSWLIICETFALAIFFYLLTHNIINQSIGQLLIAVILYLQLPAVSFISSYLSKRLDEIKKFFVRLAIVILVVIAVGIIISALMYQTLPTLVGLILFAITIWLTFFPPKFFKDMVEKWKNRK